MAAWILLLAGALGLAASAVQAGDKDMTLVAMVALKDAKLAEAEAFGRALAKHLPDAAQVKNLAVKDGVLSFDYRRAVGVVALMPAPIPWSDVEGPCATSWMWKEATAEMKGHLAHLIVTLKGKAKDRIEMALALTQVVAAAVESHHAAGVYWGDGTVVHAPKVFVEQAAEATRDSLPIALWVEFRLRANPDRTVNVVTTGLAPFGAMEIEVIQSRKDPRAVLPFVMDLALLLLNGEKIADGDTVGGSEDEKVKTRHAASVRMREGKVLRVEY